ncbi:MAG: glycosyltransferase family 39 protein [Thermoplasmata archaeon]|nr:MAG: glycosyltransferase family 39 protein [Thermoplasmata archaeon]
MTKDFKERLLLRWKVEFEIYVLMIIFAAWYLINISGAMKDDETIFAWQSYYFVRGNMPAEQFRPMSRYFMGLGQLIFGRTTFGAKSAVFLFGILSIYLTYNVTRSFSNRINGLFAALIVGIIPLYGDLSVSALMDIILTLFVMLLFYFVLKYYRTEDIVKKQRLLFVVGFLSISTLATKLYGMFFSLVVFLFLINVEWKTIRTIKLFKFKNMRKRFRKNILLLPIFVVLGVLFGLLMRTQLSDFWDKAGEKGREDILDVLPGFLDNIVMNMNSSSAYGFFIVIGIVIFFVLWLISSLLGRESLRTLKYLAKKRALDEKYHLLIFILGAIIGFIIIYSQYIWNPITLFTHIMVNQVVHLKQSSPRVVGGVLYETPPWWSYIYWTWEYLGWMFIVGLVISLIYFAFRFIKKEKMTKEMKFLFSYTFLPFVLLSALSLKLHNYFVILFPLFSIFIVLSVTSLVKRSFDRLPFESLKTQKEMLSISGVIVIMLLPGPLWMTLDDPSLGWDSGYDTAGELVLDYIEDHPGEEVQIIAFDRLSIEFYLPDETRKEISIIPLFSDNYSTDIIGRTYLYFPEEELYEMVLNDEIDMILDEPQRATDRDGLIRRYAENNSTATTYINDELVLYYL